MVEASRKRAEKKQESEERSDAVKCCPTVQLVSLLRAASSDPVQKACVRPLLGFDSSQWIDNHAHRGKKVTGELAKQ